MSKATATILKGEGTGHCVDRRTDGYFAFATYWLNLESEHNNTKNVLDQSNATDEKMSLDIC
jgi:hypothetical protein